MPYRQLSHDEIQNQRKSFPIVLIFDRLETPENAGMAFRLAEAFGVERILFIGDQIEPDNKKLLKTARSTESAVDAAWNVEIQEILDLKKSGYSLVGLELCDGSIALSEARFSQYGKIALVLGAERHGISEKLLAELDECVHIPMYGRNTSLNVITALSIALYAITEQLK